MNATVSVEVIRQQAFVIFVREISDDGVVFQGRPVTVVLMSHGRTPASRSAHRVAETPDADR